MNNTSRRHAVDSVAGRIEPAINVLPEPDLKDYACDVFNAGAIRKKLNSVDLRSARFRNITDI